MAGFRTLDDVDVKGKRVLVRLDLNVPVKDGVVCDASRIERQAPTILELAGKGARVIILSHFERPKGKVVPGMSLRPVAAALSRVLDRPVAFADDCIGESAAAAAAKLKDGDILLLENTRFHPGEEKNDPGFTKSVAALGDIFVNDAFSACHRAHATTEGLAHLLPAIAGRAMETELAHLQKALEKPTRPLMAVIGGAKVSTKIELLANLVRRVDVLFVGGAMANTFLAASAVEIGKSLCERDHLQTANDIVKAGLAAGAAVVLPSDVVVAREFRPDAPHRSTGIDAVASDEMILDIGPKTIEGFAKRLQNVATLVWNGPLGAFETKPFDRATIVAAKEVAKRTREGKLLSVAGGGDTIAALNAAGVTEDFSYVSTAGGAFLEWLEGKTLPGVEALAKSKGS